MFKWIFSISLNQICVTHLIIFAPL